MGIIYSVRHTIIPDILYKGFMNGIAEQCKQFRHHPEWTNVCESAGSVEML